MRTIELTAGMGLGLASQLHPALNLNIVLRKSTTILVKKM